MRVGIVGTGEMGRPLVDRLLAAGHDVAAYARRPEVREELGAAGVLLVDSVRALGAGCDVVLVYLFSDDQVRDLALDGELLDGLAAGSVLVIHTTGSPRTAAEISRRAADTGVHVLDAPGSGGPGQVAAGTLSLFVGGDAEIVERCRPLFAGYAHRALHFGPIGSGQKVKLVNNLLFGAHTQLALEAGRLCTALGLDEADVARAVVGSSGESTAISLAAASGSAEALWRSAGRFISKDVVVAREVAADLDAPLGTLDAVTTPLLTAP